MKTQKTFKTHEFEPYAEAENICRHCDRGKYAPHHLRYVPALEKQRNEQDNTEQLHCLNCNRPANTACVEQGHKTVMRDTAADSRCPKCGRLDCSHSWEVDDLPAPRAAERERGERISVELIDGEAGRCIGINDYRICGPKPIHGIVVSSWTTTKDDVLRAFLTPDEKHDWLTKELQIIPADQHSTLVEQRDRLLRAARSLLAMNATNYDRDTMRSEGGFDVLQAAVDFVVSGFAERSTTIEQSAKNAGEGNVE